MEVELYKWIVAQLVTMLGLFATGFVILLRKISQGAGKLHERIEKVKEDYVRKDDLRDIMEPLRDDLREIRNDVREILMKDSPNK